MYHIEPASYTIRSDLNNKTIAVSEIRLMAAHQLVSRINGVSAVDLACWITDLGTLSITDLELLLDAVAHGL